MNELTITLDRTFFVQVHPYMVGERQAARIGNTFYVSPEMYEAMKRADSEELKRLLEDIPVIDLDAVRLPPELFEPCSSERCQLMMQPLRHGFFGPGYAK
jgi:hypothetical protein